MVSRRDTLKLLTGLALCPGGFHTIVQPKKLIVPDPTIMRLSDTFGTVLIECTFKLINGHQRLESAIELPNSGWTVEWSQK